MSAATVERRLARGLPSPLAGAAAGAAGTATMTAAMALAKVSGLLGEAPPRTLTRRMLAAVGVRPRGASLEVATLAGHVGYGAAMGLLYGLLPRRLHGTAAGVLFGIAVWAVSYRGWVPKLGLMPHSKYDRPGRPTAMILAHAVYGATLGALDRRIRAGGRRRSLPARSSVARRDLLPSTSAGT